MVSESLAVGVDGDNGYYRKVSNARAKSAHLLQVETTRQKLHAEERLRVTDIIKEFGDF